MANACCITDLILLHKTIEVAILHQRLQATRFACRIAASSNQRVERDAKNSAALKSG